MSEFALDDATALREIAASVGHALWQSQIVERAVADHFVIVYGDSKEAARAKAATAFSVAETKALGNLLSMIEKKGPQDAGLFARLDDFRKRRNWLVHNSRHDHPEALRDAAARARLLSLVDEIAAAAAPLASEVQDATDEYLISRGIRSREDLAKTARRILDSWHRRGE